MTAPTLTTIVAALCERMDDREAARWLLYGQSWQLPGSYYDQYWSPLRLVAFGRAAEVMARVEGVGE